MRIAFLLICLFSISSVSRAENIRSNDALIYKSVLQAIVDHEKPEHYVVWNQTIDEATILTSRVPRHAPENQFVSSLPGLPAALQAQLLDAQRADLVAFDPAVSFVDRDSLLHAALGVIAVGLSRIVYDQRHNALVYAEDCLIIEGDTGCGGEAYWFVQSGKSWKLKKHAYLWQGNSTPFWNIASH